MGLTRSPPVPVLVASTSSTPYEAMAASQQAHIDELVQKTRTQEHMIRTLQLKLTEEQERAQDIVGRIKASVQQERIEWQEGCESIMASHRIVHLRTRMVLEKLQSELLRRDEEIRREKLAVLQRDYKLSLFQAKELTLEHKVADLEDEIQFASDRHEREIRLVIKEAELVAEELEQESDGLVAQRQEVASQLAASLRERDSLNVSWLVCQIDF